MSATITADEVRSSTGRSGTGRPVYFLCVFLFCLTWSSAFPAAKFAIAVSPPLLFLGLRFAIAGALLLLFAALTGQFSGGRKVPWVALGLLGLVNQAGYQGLFWIGMQTDSAGMATVIGSLNPILVAAAAVPLLHERLTAKRMLGLLLGLAGAVFVVRSRVALGESITGVAFFVVGMAAMVAGTLGFKRLAPCISLPVAVGAQQVAAGTALLLIGASTERVSAMQLGPQFALSMAWFVVVVSIGAFLLWFWLLRQGSAATASSLHFLIPPIGVLMSWAALGERLNARDLLGVIPVAAGIWLVTRPNPPRPITALPPRREP
jgi:drug/metabolite transporter (DMT)-like permease